MDAKQEIISRLKELTKHSYVEVLTRGNAAIWSALHACKKEVLIPEEGGWLTYFQYPKKLKLKLTQVKTTFAVLDLKDLSEKTKTADVLLYQNPGGYHAEQPIKEIYEICKKRDCLVVLDVSGGIGTKLCDGGYADIIICSFGEGKLVEAGFGGFISCKEKKVFDKIKDTFVTRFSDNIIETDYKVILEKIDNLQNRVNFLSEKRKKILSDLKDFEIINKEHLGFVVIVGYKREEEKNKIIGYCKENKLEYTECPRYIRINRPAISIEIKRLT